MKIKFSETKKIPRGTPASSEVNRIAIRAVEKLNGNKDALDLIREADKNKWFGELMYPDEINPTIKIQFRRGVFQFMKMLIKRKYSSFWMTVINENVDFGKD